MQRAQPYTWWPYNTDRFPPGTKEIFLEACAQTMVMSSALERKKLVYHHELLRGSWKGNRAPVVKCWYRCSCSMVFHVLWSSFNKSKSKEEKGSLKRSSSLAISPASKDELKPPLASTYSKIVKICQCTRAVLLLMISFKVPCESAVVETRWSKPRILTWAPRWVRPPRRL